MSRESRRSLLEVAIRRLRGEDAPIALELGDEVDAGRAGVARQYRSIDGRLFRQVFGDELDAGSEHPGRASRACARASG